jgi:hypothetical protein
VGDTGREHPPLEQLKTPISTSICAKSDARNAPSTSQNPQDPNLAKVVERWPNLSEHIKLAINALIQTNIQGDTK